MKKRIFWTGAAILVVLVTGLLIWNSTREDTLLDEIASIHKLIGDGQYDQANELLNRCVSVGKYADVEKDIKQYLRDSLGLISTMHGEAKNDEFKAILSAQNIANDDKDFTKSRDYLNKMKAKIEDYRKNYETIYGEEAKTGLIDNANLSGRYAEYFKNEVDANTKSENDTKFVKNSIDMMNSLTSLTGYALDLLESQPNAWKIEDNQIVFSNKIMEENYFSIVEEIDEFAKS